jgi:hypothetical protein
MMERRRKRNEGLAATERSVDAPGIRLFRKEKPMNRFWNRISLALFTLALPWSAAPGFAQQPAKDLVPFKASWTSQSQPIVIATDPPIVASPVTLTGQSDLFGPFTGVGLATRHLGVDGNDLFVTAVGEWSMANGDALSYEVTAVFTPQGAPGSNVGAILITNGKGRFLGARGSAFYTATAQTDPVTRLRTIVISAEGLITRPKP